MRHARVWYVIGSALTMLVIVSSLVPSRDLPHLRVSDKVEHLVAYFGLALGGGIDIAPGLMGLGREADWRDFYADSLAVGLGLAVCMAGLRHWATWFEQWPKRR